MAILTNFSATCVILLFAFSSATEKCSDGSWFDTKDQKCTPCSPCSAKMFELAPCSENHDVLCVDLGTLKFGNIYESSRSSPHKWHEMEGYDELQAEGGETKIVKLQKEPTTDLEEKQWNTMLVITLLAGLCLILGALIIMLVKNYGMLSKCGSGKPGAPRSRLFSRDRLNTTEYMNNLAGMDRRLAMDELLEKKRRAVFEPQRLNENVYVDEVFINLSGIPRFEDPSEDRAPDYSRSLLRLQETQ